MQIIKEMALSRTDAMDRCLELGKRFIEHFHKIYDDGAESPDFLHRCTEMQAWLNSCRVLKLKSTKRNISNSDLIDWFFTAGGGVDSDNGFNTLDEIDAYNEFFVTLAANKDRSVYDVAGGLLK